MRRESPPPDEKTRKEIREFFGIDQLERKPIACNSFKFMVKVFSLMPDQHNNPFAKYANDPEYNTGIVWPKVNAAGRNNSVGQRTGLDAHDRAKSHISRCPFSLGKDGMRDNSVPGRKEGGSSESVHPSGVQVGESSHHNEPKSDSTSGALSKDGVLSGQEMIIDELGMSKNSKVMDKHTYDEEGTNVESVGCRNVHDDLSSIQRILMDDSDDEDMLQLVDKDVNLDLARDLGSILDMEKFGDKSLTMESMESEKLTAGEIMIEKSVGEKRRKDVEVNRSFSESGIRISQFQKSIDARISSSPELVNQNGRSKDKKLSKQNVQQEQSEIRGLTSTRSENENVGEFDGKFVGNLVGMNLPVASAKVKHAKGNKTKVKNSKMSKKNVESGKHKLVSVEGKAYNTTRSEGHDPMIHGKTLKQDAIGISRRPSTKEDKESWPTSCERLRYTREQLLHLGKTAFVPDHIKNAVREIGAEIHEKQQISAAFEMAVSGILKDKKRGSSSEAKKEKKKLKRRKKRAELNRKLGVKRLKLIPIVKPKVVQHCRHYLNGRCHEGEKCKFSHDVVPLTKSKPCCHFTRQSCMKGDDCPFDHQLSKYPCNNFADTGFCGRGESCLFSHKISVKEGSEPSTMALKCDTSSIDQHNMSKSKQQIESNLPFTSRKAIPNMVMETLATKTSQQAKKPKGLSFVSFGGSQLDNSIQPKEPDLVATLIDIQGSGTHQGIDYPLFEKTLIDTSRENKQPNLPPHKDNSSGYNSSGNPLLNDSADYQPKETVTRYDFAIGIPPQHRAFSFSEMSSGIPSPTPSSEDDPNRSEMFEGVPNQEKTEGIVPSPTKRALDFSEMNLDTPTPSPDRALNLSEMCKGALSPDNEMFKGAPVPEKAKGIRVSSSDGPLYDVSGGKSASVFSSKVDNHIQTSLGQFSTKVDLPVKNPQSDSQSDYAVGVQTPNQACNFSEIFKDRAVNVSEMFKGAPNQLKASGINVSSSDEPSNDIFSGKSASVFSTRGGTNMQTSVRKKGNINVSEKSKEVRPEPGLWGSQTFLSQYSTKVDPPSSSQSGYAVGTQSQNRAFNFSDIIKAIPTQSPDRAIHLSEMFKSAPTPANAQGSSHGPSYGISGGKSANVFPTKGDIDLQISFGEKGNINVSEKSKEVLPERTLCGSQTSLSQISTKVVPVKNAPSYSQRALQSALAFAAKYQSGIKTSSVAASKGNNLKEGASYSGSRQSEPLEASKILQFLNRQGDKKKQ